MKLRAQSRTDCEKQTSSFFVIAANDILRDIELIVRRDPANVRVLFYGSSRDIALRFALFPENDRIRSRRVSNRNEARASRVSQTEM